MMSKWLAPLCALGTMILSTAVWADAAPDSAPGSVSTALAAIEIAKSVAKAGRGSLLMVGSILSSDDHPQDQVLVVLDYPIVPDMKAGMVLILAKMNCEPIEECLIARRVIGVDANDSVETEPYGGAEGLLFTQIKASLLGSVAYTVDLGTGAIRDLHPEVLPAHSAPATISVREAAARETARTRGIAAADPSGT
jgi:hypothetical protein